MAGPGSVTRETREPLPSAAELAGAAGGWLLVPVLGAVGGAFVGDRLGRLDVWTLAGALAGVLLVWLGSLLVGVFRRRRIRAALRAPRRAGAVAYVEWRRRRGRELPYLMVADSRDGPVRWCVPLLRRPHLPVGVDVVRVHGGLRPGRWVVPVHPDGPLWPAGRMRHRPLWTSERVLGALPGDAPMVPRPRDPGALAAEPHEELRWQPVRLSLKRTADRVAVVAHELHTGRVLDSGFLPRGIGQGRAPEQNGLYARCGRRSMVFGPGWRAVAVLGEDAPPAPGTDGARGPRAIPVRPVGLAR
ncbi:MAG TPA: hypothetical protein VGD67_23670 [Pseudonocardiaceae bacterium]